MLSDDEIASYEPTTPFKAVPVNLKKTGARTTKPSSRSGPVAGPSSKPASGQPAAKRKHNHKSPEPSDSEAGRLGLGEDVEVTDTGKGKPNKGQVTVDANGKATLKGKGKAKAEPQPKNPTKVDTTDVDEADVVDDTEGEAVAKAPVRTTTVAKAKKPPATASRSTKSSEKELNRLRQKIADVERQRDALSTQLDEVFHERNTAAEESLDHQSLQYEARLKTQEKLIQELTSQLARVEPLARSGKTSLLHFLTRDAADEEQRGLENEVNHWKDIAQAKDAVLAEKDRRIAELERLERDVQYELKAEIERSKSLASKASRNQPPGSATRGRGIGGGIFGADEPKNTAVIKFYEDLTNLLVPNVKIETGKYLGLDETSFTCVYTYVDLNKAQNEEGDRGKEKSLSFTLRFYYDLLIPEEERTSADEHVTSHNQLTQRIKYTPLELNKESFDFVEKLKFLGDSFTFGPDQLALFLKTMYETLGGAIKEDDEDEMDE